MDGEGSCQLVVQLLRQPGCLTQGKGQGGLWIIAVGIIRVRGVENDKPDVGAVKSIVQGTVSGYIICLMVILGVSGRAFLDGCGCDIHGFQ